MTQARHQLASDAQLSDVERVKAESRGLYGSVAEELGQTTEHFEKDATQVLKHHGTYQQDNRDSRPERKRAGLGWEYKMMVRTKFPGGALSAGQYLLCDLLCEKYGQGDLRVTSRQGLQFHGVLKRNLRALIHDLNRLARITMLGASGDVVRNTMAPPVADIDPLYAPWGADLLALAGRISDRFLPKTRSYFDLWLDDEKVTVGKDGTVTFGSPPPQEVNEEPLYGPAYLPRKFKIGIATGFDNSIDVFTQDVGLIAVTGKGRLEGFEVLVGGGLGHTHGRADTFPWLALPMTFVASSEELIPLLEAVVKIHRDHGDRSDRKHARLKYLVGDWGIEKFRQKVFEYAGRSFPEPRGVQPSARPDYLGWSKQSQPGLNYVGVWIENGRIRDLPGSYQFRTGLRAIIERFKPSVRLTPHHNLVLAYIMDEDVEAVQALLDRYRIPTDRDVSVIRRRGMACPSLPLCPLALADSERVMPEVMCGIEQAGHAEAEVVIRMTGCPNSCARPPVAEIGIIGQGPGKYALSVGGDAVGSRLGERLLEEVSTEALVPAICTLLGAWKAGRREGERFGDWSARIGVETLRALLRK